MQKEDLAIWQANSSRVTIEDLVSSFQHPSGFQRELSSYIENLFKNIANPTSIEVGSSFGITSALLPKKFEKSILDFDVVALSKGKSLFETVGQMVRVINMDMFDLYSLDRKFDLVFNAGVLEHLAFDERVKLIKNMVQVSKDGGYVIIAIPNHKSVPYRVGYLYCNLLGKWIYPKEFKITGIEKEISFIKGIQLIETIQIDKENIYNYLPAFLKKIFQFLDNWFKYEGYLKVFVLKK